MVSAISGYNSNIEISRLNFNRTTSIQEDFKEAATIANSYYSLSDTVQPVKGYVENNAAWAYESSRNLGLPSGVNIEGDTDLDSRKVVVDIRNLNTNKYPTEQKQDETNNKMSPKENAKTISSEAMAFMGAAFGEVLDEVSGIYTNNNETENNKEVEDNEVVIDEKPSNTFFHSYKNGITSYVKGVQAYNSYQQDNISYLA